MTTLSDGFAAELDATSVGPVHPPESPGCRELLSRTFFPDAGNLARRRDLPDHIDPGPVLRRSPALIAQPTPEAP